MSEYDIIRIIVDAIEEHNYHDSYGIYHVSNCIIVSMISHNNSITELMSINEIVLCYDPKHRIWSTISNMINKLRGGIVND